MKQLHSYRQLHQLPESNSYPTREWDKYVNFCM